MIPRGHREHGELAEDVQRVGHGPGEPVELGDGQGVALADGGQGLVEAGAGAAGSCEPLVEVDPVRWDAERGQGLALGGARASRALQGVTELTGDSKTDSINRALQVYAYLEEVSANGGAVYVRESRDSELQLLKIF